jgi:hypothetical protein
MPLPEDHGPKVHAEVCMQGRQNKVRMPDEPQSSDPAITEGALSEQAIHPLASDVGHMVLNDNASSQPTL